MPLLAQLARLSIWLPDHAFLASALLAGALAMSAVLVRNVGGPVTGRRRRTAMVVLLLLSGLVLSLGGSLFLIGIKRWGYLLALLPGAAIARHAVYLRLVRRRALTAPVAAPPGLGQAPGPGAPDG